MPQKSAQTKIPYSNKNRAVIRAGKYQCCGNEWTRPTYDDEQICYRCEEFVDPIEWDVEWRQRWYGHFKCMAKTGKSKKPCGRTWTSSWTWTIDNQIQTTKCKTCNTSTMPYKIEKRDSDDDEDGLPHPCHLCSVCTRLGRPCNEGRTNRRFRTERRYENELSYAMRRIRF